MSLYSAIILFVVLNVAHTSNIDVSKTIQDDDSEMEVLSFIDGNIDQNIIQSLAENNFDYVDNGDDQIYEYHDPNENPLRLLEGEMKEQGRSNKNNSYEDGNQLVSLLIVIHHENISPKFNYEI